MRSIKFYLILLFAICTFAVNAQTPQGYPANYANGPRFKALVYYTRHRGRGLKCASNILNSSIAVPRSFMGYFCFTIEDI